jgi:hypothetical protein
MLTNIRRRSAAIFAAVFGPNGVGFDELLLVIGLLLIARGLWLAWEPAAYLVPGLVILWIALPSRSVFVAQHHEPEKPSRRKT